MMFKGRGASSRLSQHGRWLVRRSEIFSLKKVVHSGIYWSMVMEEIIQSSSACYQGKGFQATKGIYFSIDLLHYKQIKRMLYKI